MMLRRVLFLLLLPSGFSRPCLAQTAPTFVGIRPFLSAPYEPDLDKLHADFAVLGVPFDEGTWGQPGERYGPRDLRENSQDTRTISPKAFITLMVTAPLSKANTGRMSAM